MSKTLLNDYILWFDGDITVSPSNLDQYISFAPYVTCDVITEDIKNYNKMVSKDNKILTKQQCNIPSPIWVLPEQYINLDILELILTKHEILASENDWSADELEVRIKRITQEYKLFKKNNLIPLMQTLVYIIDMLTKHSIVWGPGRGSSVSSYILYILQVHDVDSFLYELEISDFLQ